MKGPWIALDCGIGRNPKMEGLKRASSAYLYVLCLAHCGDELTDGVIREAAIPRLLVEAKATRADLAALVDNGLLTRQEDVRTYRIADYLEWNPARSDWQRKREQNAARQQRFRDKHSERNALHDGLGNGSRDAFPQRTTRPRHKEGAREPQTTIARGASSTRSVMSGHPCPHCGVALRTSGELADHVERHHVAA